MAVVRFQLTSQYCPELYQRAFDKPGTTPALALGSVEEAKEIKRTRATYKYADAVTCLVEVTMEKARARTAANPPIEGAFISITPPPNAPRDPEVAFAEIVRAPNATDSEYWEAA